MFYTDHKTKKVTHFDFCVGYPMGKGNFWVGFCSKHKDPVYVCADENPNAFSAWRAANKRHKAVFIDGCPVNDEVERRWLFGKAKNKGGGG